MLEEVMNRVGTLISIPMEHHVNPRGMMTIGGTVISTVMIMVGTIQEPLGQTGNQGLILIMIAQNMIAHLVDHVVTSEMLADTEKNLSIEIRGV
jgi:hypothetical protein